MPSRRRPLIATALLALALGGCANGTATPAGEPVGSVLVSRSSSGAATADALRERQGQWQALGVRDYDVVVTLGCFCPPERTQPTRVEVRDGRVVRATTVATGAAQPADAYPTIDALFERALEAAAAGEQLEAAHDERFGWPTRLMIGSLAADAGTLYELRDVRRID